MLILEGSRTRVRGALKNARNETDVFLKVKPTVPLLAEILDYTSVKRLLCTPGVRSTMPEKVLASLKEVGVQVEVVSVKRGRPLVHSEELVSGVRALAGEGLSAKEIASSLKLPLRTVYYHLKRMRRV